MVRRASSTDDLDHISSLIDKFYAEVDVGYGKAELIDWAKRGLDDPRMNSIMVGYDDRSEPIGYVALQYMPTVGRGYIFIVQAYWDSHHDACEVWDVIARCADVCELDIVATTERSTKGFMRKYGFEEGARIMRRKYVQETKG